MTDIEVLEAMFSRASIRCTRLDPSSPDMPAGVAIVLNVRAERDNEPNKGYTGFFTEFHFDAAGNLTAIGAWE